MINVGMTARRKERGAFARPALSGLGCASPGHIVRCRAMPRRACLAGPAGARLAQPGRAIPSRAGHTAPCPSPA